MHRYFHISQPTSSRYAFRCDSALAETKIHTTRHGNHQMLQQIIEHYSLRDCVVVLSLLRASYTAAMASGARPATNDTIVGCYSKCPPEPLEMFTGMLNYALGECRTCATHCVRDKSHSHSSTAVRHDIHEQCSLNIEYTHTL